MAPVVIRAPITSSWRAATLPLLPFDLGSFFQSYLPALPPPPPDPIECRTCGNPAVVKDAPCRFCGVATAPSMPRPRRRPEHCPRCGVAGRLRVTVERDVLTGDVWAWVGCHGVATKAVLSEAEIMQSVERDDLFALLAPRLADAIARLATDEGHAAIATGGG